MSDITETMTVKNGQAAVKTVTVAGKLSPKTSATDTIALVETSDGKQAALKVYNINGGGGGGAGGDFLPLSGGTLTGPLGLQSGSSTFKFVPRSYGNLELTLGDALMFEVEFSSGLFPAGNGNRTLGRAARLWRSVYTKALNNGADIAIPTEGGTMARIEDINAAVGDISTALTARLGE